MGTARAPGALKAAILHHLKEHGDVQSRSGGAQKEVVGDIEDRREIFLHKNNWLAAFTELEDEGCIKRERGSNPRLVYAVRLVDLGEYEDPFADGEMPAELIRMPRQYNRASSSDTTPSTSSSPKRSVDKILSDVARLSLPERLMLAGMIVDGCAGEVDETYTSLKQLIGGI